MNEDYKFLLVTCFTVLISFTVLGQSILRGPYLQKGTPTSVVVKWRTDSSTSSILEYSTDMSYNMTESDAGSKTDHELEITGLSPDTKYFYRIGTSGGSADLYFITHPTVGTEKPYRFWVLGDAGTASAPSYENYINEVRDDYTDTYLPTTPDGKTDGILFLGDNAYTQGTDAEFQLAVFDIFPDELKNTISWSTFGNHEGLWNSNSDDNEGLHLSSPYYDIFTFPKNGESGGMGSGTEAYYSFDYGNIHFIVLNSDFTDYVDKTDTSMFDWVVADIQSTTQKWIVAFWHHPPYSKGSHNSDSELKMVWMRENFLPILENNGVDLVLTGHSHSYERSYFINGHYDLSPTYNSTIHTIANGTGDGKDGNAYQKTSFGSDAGKGAVYVVTGSAGHTSEMRFSPHPANFRSFEVEGSCVLEVDGDNLTLKFLEHNFTTGDYDISDYFTINKGPDYTYDGVWFPSAPPTTNIEDIYIKSGSAILTNDITARSVIVYPGAGLTVNTGNTLTATNSINLNSTSKTYSSLKLDGSLSGTVNYNRYTSSVGPIGTNDLISAPLSGQSFVNFAASNPNLASDLNDISVKAFAPFNNVSGNYENYDTDSGPGSTVSLTKGKGFRAATDDGSTLKFTGVVNKGTEPVNITFGASGWNLIGNPYPSYIDAKDFLNFVISSSTGSPVVTNKDLLVDENKAIYGYDGNASDGWTIWNNLTGADIAPGQGFFVNASNVGSLIAIHDIEFDPSIRKVGSGDDFIGGRSSDTNNVLTKINLIKGSNSYSTDIYFVDGATKGLDPGYDAGAFQGNAAGVFTHLVEDNTGVEMAIQALPYEDFNDLVVPLGVKSDSGMPLTLGINDASTLPLNINVYLEDNVANTLTLLSSGDFTFTPSENLTGTGRFFVHFTSSTLSLTDEDVSGLQIFTASSPRNLFVNGKLLDTTVLDLYDLQGRIVLNKDLDINSISNKINVDYLNAGIYIVKLNIGGLTRTQKVIIR